MPGTPLTCVSIAVVVVCSTVCASAPVKLLVICTVGGVILGYWLIGILRMARPPTSTMTIEITIAVTGRRRNIFEEAIYCLFFFVVRLCRALRGTLIHYFAGAVAAGA